MSKQMKLKTSWKGFLLIGISILITLMVSIGCKKDVDNIKTVDYIYKNASGKDFELSVFNSNNTQIASYTIMNGDQITSHTTRSEGIGIFQYEDHLNMIGDSVSIKFSDNRCIGYKKSVPDKIFDIKEYDNYSDELMAQSSFSLIFSITTDAYNGSVDCARN